ncbi:MAG: DnaJ domain-containing protein [Candidatus Scalinduaceae bacterium]
MTNYYQVLRVREGSNNEEIKNSFRKLAKEYHPDKNRMNGVSSEEKIKLLITAYKTLIDSEKRIHYDKLLQNKNEEIIYYKENVENTKFSLRAQAKMILHDLLKENGHQAVRDYEQLRKENKGFDLFTVLVLKDYLDCLFLLAEEYEKQGNYEMAFKLYEDVYKKENGSPARRYLLEEIKERIIRLSCKKITKIVQTKSAIAYLRRALDIKLSKIEKAFIYKKIADCYLRLGEWNSAIVNFDTAMSLNPKLKGAQTLRNKLYNHFSQQNYSI